MRDRRTQPCARTGQQMPWCSSARAQGRNRTQTRGRRLALFRTPVRHRHRPSNYAAAWRHHKVPVRGSTHLLGAGGRAPTLQLQALDLVFPFLLPVNRHLPRCSATRGGGSTHTVPVRGRYCAAAWPVDPQPLVVVLAPQFHLLPHCALGFTTLEVDRMCAGAPPRHSHTTEMLSRAWWGSSQSWVPYPFTNSRTMPSPSPATNTR